MIEKLEWVCRKAADEAYNAMVNDYFGHHKIADFQRAEVVGEIMAKRLRPLFMAEA